jgi:hypothetical protein
MATPLADTLETFSAPIESVIIALGQGIALAQQALDKNSISTQEKIDSDPVLSQYGLQATWYQFPTVNMQLKISLSITQDQAPAPASSSAAIASPFPGRFRIIAQPLSASFQNQFNYDAQAATQVNLTLVPVPAPRSGDQVNNPPQNTSAAVLAVALASGAPFVKANAQGVTVDAQGNAYTTVTNFNATARMWYVMQYAPSNAAIVPVVVAVDDATLSVRIVTSS